MKDALGGIINIWFIAVFIVIISGYLAFSIQYNKAFRMKNEIIKAIEQCDGYESGTSQNCAQEIITSYMKQIGYSVPSWTWNECRGDSDCLQGDGFWVKRHKVSDSSTRELGSQYYYTVATAVNTDIPVFRNIMPSMDIFQVSGNTRRITIRKNNS